MTRVLLSVLLLLGAVALGEDGGQAPAAVALPPSAAPAATRPDEAGVTRGLRVLTASWDQRLRIWDASTGERLFETRAGSVGVDGPRLVVSNDKKVELYDLRTLERVRAFSAPGPLGLISVSEDVVVASSYIPAKGGVGASTYQLSAWETGTGRHLYTKTRPFIAAFLELDGPRLLYVEDGPEKTHLRVLDARTGEVTATLEHPFHVARLHVSGPWLLVGDLGGQVHVYDRTALTRLATLGEPRSGGRARVRALDAKDGRILVTLHDLRVFLYPSLEAKPQRMTLERRQPLTAVLSPKGPVIAWQRSGADEGGLTLFSPDGRVEGASVPLPRPPEQLAGHEGLVLWGGRSGGEVRGLPGDAAPGHVLPHDERVGYLRFLPP